MDLNNRAQIKNSLFAFAAVMFLTGLSGEPAFSQPPKVEPSPELERLHSQLGTWRVKAQTFDPKGNVVRTKYDRTEISLKHNGLMIHSLTYADGVEEPVWRVWQYYDRYDAQLHDVSFDLVGHFEHRVEVNVGKDYDGALAFAFPEKQAFQDGVPRNWRKTYSHIEPDSYQISWHYSEDGETWTLLFVLSHQRLEPTVAEKPPTEREPVNPAYEPLAWLAGDWQADFKPRGEDTAAPTMAFEWGDQNRSFVRMTGTQPAPDGRLIPEYESMVIWHPVQRQFVFQGVYKSDAGRVVETGDIDLLDGGAVRLNMQVHYPAGTTLPFSEGAVAGPGGHTLEFRRTFHREGDDGLRGVFRIKRGGVWENPHPELGMGDGYPWRRVGE